MEKRKVDVVFAEWNTQIGQGEELVKSLRRTDAKLPVIVTAPTVVGFDQLLLVPVTDDATMVTVLAPSGEVLWYHEEDSERSVTHPSRTARR